MIQKSVDCDSSDSEIRTETETVTEVTEVTEADENSDKRDQNEIRTEHQRRQPNR